MEINLIFDEKECRAIYETSYQELLSNLSDELEAKKSTGKALLGLVIFFFSLSFYNWVWLYFLGIFIVIAASFFLRRELKKRNVYSKIRKSRKDVDEFIARMKSIQKVTYKLNEETILYYENGKFNYTYSWNKIESYAQGANYFALFFHSPPTNFLIPRSMTSLKEFEGFERFVKRKLKELGFEFN